MFGRAPSCFFLLLAIRHRYRTAIQNSKRLPSKIHKNGSINHLSTEYTECQAFFPVVRIGSPDPLTCKGVLLLPPLGPRGEKHSLAEEKVGPNSDEGKDTLELYVYYNPSTHLRKPCQNGDPFLAVLAMEESFHSVDHLVAVALRLAEITGLKSKGVS
jgi:hypothetical protein